MPVSERKRESEEQDPELGWKSRFTEAGGSGAVMASMGGIRGRVVVTWPERPLCWGAHTPQGPVSGAPGHD